jgi:hypothetical protein
MTAPLPFELAVPTQTRQPVRPSASSKADVVDFAFPAKARLGDNMSLAVCGGLYTHGQLDFQ